MRAVPSVKRTPLMVLVVAATMVVTACKDSRIAQLQVGISKDSMLKVLATGAPAGDSLPFIYRHNGYLTGGKFFDLYYYDRKNRKFAETKIIREKDVVPIFVVDGVVEGWGWPHADSLAARYRIAVRNDLLR